ncbi:MAG: hypothetical protein ACLP4W_02075 [Mycobacterium sp.]|uniref:hypothetical protein n=1 Tax=Mycobacterium sp. TaxID=1785 RepID=UPI003F9BCB36
MPEPSVHVVRRDQFSGNTPQTSGLHREVAFDSRNPAVENSGIDPVPALQK